MVKEYGWRSARNAVETAGIFKVRKSSLSVYCKWKGNIAAADCQTHLDGKRIQHHQIQQLISMSRHQIDCMLKECTKLQDLEYVRRVQCLMLENGLDSMASFCDCLVRLFSSCQSLIEAEQTFEKVRNPSVYTWSAIIDANAGLGDSELALQLYEKMSLSGIMVDTYIYAAALKACSVKSALFQGKFLHEQVIENNLQFDIVLGSSLVNMYAKCGNLTEAYRSLEKLPNSNVVAWGAMISGYVQHGEGLLALECFYRMPKERVKPNKVIFTSILKGCGSMMAVEHVRYIHQLVIEAGLGSDVVVGSTIVDVYAKCWSLEEARKAFDKLPAPNVVCWNAMIAGYAHNGNGLLAIRCFLNLELEGVKSDAITFSSILKVCGTIGAINYGRFIHDQLNKYGIQSNAFIGSTLIDMYAKCGSLKEGCQVFERFSNRNIVLWSTMLTAFVHHGEKLSALEHFDSMQQEGIRPDRVAFLSMLKICDTIEHGRHMHERIIELGIEEDVVMANTLIDMYAKCESMLEAHKVFQKNSHKDAVSWSSMIAGYAQVEEGFTALEWYNNMQHEGVKADIVTYSSTLKACASVGAIEQGRHIHNQIMKSDCQLDIFVGNILIDMYSRCGSMEEALKIFKQLPNQDIISWGAMVVGYALHGDSRQAMLYFDKMQQYGFKPDNVAFTGILSACNHAGFVEEGIRYFRAMVEHHSLIPNIIHFNCIGDLLSRAGCFKEAEYILKFTSVNSWTSLLSACRVYGNIELGRQYFQKIVQLDSHCTAGYVLMSNMYANANIKRILMNKKSWDCVHERLE